MTRGRISADARPTIDFDALTEPVVGKATRTPRGRTAEDFHPWVKTTVVAALALPNDNDAMIVPIVSDEQGVELNRQIVAYGLKHDPQLTAKGLIVDGPKGKTLEITAKVTVRRPREAPVNAPKGDPDYAHGRSTTGK